jgi:hypothetical protein
MTQASIKNAPIKMPGKKPAKKTPMGNLLHLGATSDAVELTPAEMVGWEVEVVVVVAVEVLGVLLAELEFVEAVVLLVSAMMLQIEGPDWEAMQAYPNGQHASPHVGSLSPSRVVKTLAWALAEAFWAWTLQVMVWMLAQLSVSGQQSADDELSNEMQLLPLGHVKSPGSLESTAEHDREESSRPKSERGRSGLADALVERSHQSGNEQALGKCMADESPTGESARWLWCGRGKGDELCSRQLWVEWLARQMSKAAAVTRTFHPKPDSSKIVAPTKKANKGTWSSEQWKK